MSKQEAFDFLDKMAEFRSRASRLVFQLGVEMLVAQGSTENSARSLLGKKIKEIGKPALMRAIISAAFNEVVDPRSYIAAATGAASPNSKEPEPVHSAGIQPWMA